MNTGIASIPRGLYRAEQVRELDREAIRLGITGYELMQRAGRAAFAHLQQLLCNRQPAGAPRILIACGGGNNGGDGYVIACLAHAAGYQVDLLSLIDIGRLQGDALQAAQDWQRVGGVCRSLPEIRFAGYDAVVDAILGTGLQRQVDGEFKAAIEGINASGLPVLAVDVPSGLSADTGQPLAVAIRADITVSFIGLKQGLFTGSAADYCGAICYEDLAVPSRVFDAVKPAAELIDEQEIRTVLPRRRRDSHKGDFGHVLIIGGAPGTAGAVQMAGLAALRVGAGLVSVATAPEHATLLSVHQPELMSHAVETAADLQPLLQRASVVAIGPGLGQSDWATALLQAAWACQRPLIVDADGLNLLAAEPRSRDHWLITPHPGEAGRLLGCSSAQIQADRYRSVAELSRRYRAVCVLKGAGSLIAAPDTSVIAVCDRGHPGMATGGTGDILTGVLAGLAAQHRDFYAAARAGVCLHALAAEQAAKQGERGMIATDLLPILRDQVNH